MTFLTPFLRVVVCRCSSVSLSEKIGPFFARGLVGLEGRRKMTPGFVVLVSGVGRLVVWFG